MGKFNLARVCEACLEEDEKLRADINGRCEVCEGTSFVDYNVIRLELTDEKVDEFLDNKNTTLWMNWDITDAEEKIKAREFIYKLLHDLVQVSY